MKVAGQTTLYGIQMDPDKSFKATAEDVREYSGICIISSVAHNTNISHFWNSKVGISTVIEKKNTPQTF
jgi:hypothetical protein